MNCRFLLLKQILLPGLFFLAFSFCAPGADTPAFKIQDGGFEKQGMKDCIPCEPSQNAFGYQPFRMISMSRAGIADERASFGGHRALGIPKWSMAEWNPDSGIELTGTPLSYQTCGCTAYPRAQYPDNVHLAPATIEALEEHLIRLEKTAFAPIAAENPHCRRSPWERDSKYFFSWCNLFI